MKLQKFLPDSSLRDMIRFYWFMEGTNSDNNFSRILPFGALDIIIHRRDPMILGPGFGTDIEPIAFVEGQYKTHQFKRPGMNTSLVGISIYPWASQTLFGMPSIDFTGEIVDLSYIPDSSCHELIDLTFCTSEKAEMIEKMNIFFSRKVGDLHHTMDADLKSFAMKLIHHNDQPIQEVTDKYWGYSTRLLQIKFKEVFGLTITEFRRKIRLQKAVEWMNQDEPDLMDVALDLGFFDQAHFSKTFKHFAGVSPKQYINQMSQPDSHLPMEELFS